MRASKYRRKNINVKIFDSINNIIDKNILPLRYSPLCYNFTFDGGALGSKMGIEKAKTTVLATPEGRHYLPTLPNGLGVKNIHIYRNYNFNSNIRDDKIIVRADNDVYYETSLFESDTFHEIANLTASGKDCSACYRYNNKDVFLLSSENGLLHIYNGLTVESITDAPNMTSMCVHSERIFATVTGEKNSIWFSDDFNPSNWKISSSTAGFINFDDEGGAVIKVVAFLDYVYIFREYGIMRLTAYGDQKEFSISKLFVSSGRIYPDTIAYCGDRIIFMAEDGLYYLDGYSIRPIAPNIDKFLPIKKDNAVACFLNGKYYLAINLDYGVDNANKILSENNMFSINNSLIIYDVKKNTFAIMRGVDICALTAVQIFNESSVLVAFNNDNKTKIGRIVENGKIFDDMLPKYWTTANTDLGYSSRIKTIREISFISNIPCVLGVDIDGEIAEYNFSGSTRPIRVVINRNGNMIRIYLRTSTNGVNITAPNIVVDIV